MPDLSSQLIEQVRQAADASHTLEIRGSGSKAFYGRERAGQLLSLENHSGIVDYQPEELVLTARAGTSLAEIETALADRGQHLASDPPRFGGGGTLGGSLACNLSGPSRPWAGSLRDQVLGLRLINGKGDHLRFGGQVMKNVAGYDVSRMQAGALGCLGVITEITVKVLPRPAASATLALPCPDSEASLQLLATLGRSPLPLSGACWVAGTQYLRLAGARSAVDASTSALTQGHGAETADERFWQQLRDHQLPFFETTGTLWRHSTSPQARVPSGIEWCLDWGGAQRWMTSTAPGDEATAAAAAFRGGDRSGEVFPPLRTGLPELHRRLKLAFDPLGLFNPSRLYSWL